MREYTLLILMLMASVVAFHDAPGQSFHGLSLDRAGDSSVALTSLQGKKVVVVLAATDAASDTTGFTALQQQFSDLLVIELPVGQLAQSGTVVQGINSANWWLATPTQDSTDNNGQLLHWLTRKEGNQHFEITELQVGQKFFIDGGGELYAVLPPAFALTDPRMEAILTRTPLSAPPQN